MGNPILQTQKLSFQYGLGTPFARRALHNVDFTLRKGEFLGIIGHTGSGKSTLIQHLNGLLKPQTGTVLLDGRDITQQKQVCFRVGLVFQYPEYQLFEETVFKDVAFGPRNMGLPEDEISRRVAEALAFVGLPEETAALSPFDLSGGQKRRAAIAGVIAMRPEVLILDEPTAGLDPRGRDEILAHISAYHQTSGGAVILVSHSMEEVARKCSRIVVMKDAGILMEGAPKEVFSRQEELEASGLAVPTVSRVMRRLRALGLPVDPAVYTVEDAVAQLTRARKTLGDRIEC